MKFMWMFVFWILPLLGILYIAWHVWTILPLAAAWKGLIIALGVMCFSLLFLSIFRRFDSLPLSVSQWLYEIGTSSIFVMLYLVIVFLVLDLGRLVHLVPKAFLYHNGYTALGIFVLIFGLFLYGNLHYYNKVRVPLELKTSKPLPKTYKVVMASDFHLGYHNPRKELSRWVDMINAEKPDFILIAGDIIDGSMRPLLEERMAEEFHRLTAPVYACLGNHEFYAGHPAAKQFLKDAGIRLLVDEAAVIDSSIVASLSRIWSPRFPLPSTPSSSTTSPTTSIVLRLRVWISSSADIPIADRSGPSRGSRTPFMNAPGAVISAVTPSTMSPRASASGAASSASAPRVNMS